MIAVEESARQGVPIQFHTGLGDPDLDLTLVDPAALRLLFSDRFRAAPIVLLHTGYPYVRSLAYLAAMFPNVYADMGETILFAAGEATEIYRELLGLAPASKLLFSTDASLVPELYWVGRADRPAGARPRARRAHRRRRDRRADRARLGRADPVAQLGGRLRALILGGGAGGRRRTAAPDQRRQSEQPIERHLALAEQALAADRDDHDEDHGQDDLAQPVEQRRVLDPAERLGQPDDQRSRPGSTRSTEPIPPMTSIVITRNVRSK